MTGAIMDWVLSILAVIVVYIVTIAIAVLVLGFIFAAVFIIKIWRELNR